MISRFPSVRPPFRRRAISFLRDMFDNLDGNISRKKVSIGFAIFQRVYLTYGSRPRAMHLYRMLFDTSYVLCKKKKKLFSDETATIGAMHFIIFLFVNILRWMCRFLRKVHARLMILKSLHCVIYPAAYTYVSPNIIFRKG